MSYYVVAREEPLTVGNSNIKYEHNERKNLTYLNPDIDLSKENYYFKKPEKSYTALFHEMEEQGLFSTRRIKLNDPHTKIGSEIIVAVAGDYFESKEQAIQFFKVANDALNEFFSVTLPDGTKVSGSDLCMSSVVHCDEANYGLHYVTTCCTAKELFKKRTKKQIAENKKPVSQGWYVQLSHSNFWDSHKDETGKLVYSYSILNDVVADAYKKAGYSDIERGKKGSTAKHLHPNEFKAMMRSIEDEAKKSLSRVDAKKIAGKYVMDEKSYDSLVTLQENLAVQQEIIKKSQDMIDRQQQSIKEERYKVKKKELNIEASQKRTAELEDKYELLKEKSEERRKELDEKAMEIENQREIICFWETMFKWFLDMVKKILQWVDQLIHGDLSADERTTVHSSVNKAYDEMIRRIQTMDMALDAGISK